MDRLYLRTPTKIAVIDHEKKRTFVLQKNAMPDAGCLTLSVILFLFSTHILLNIRIFLLFYIFDVSDPNIHLYANAVIWNPGYRKAKALPDLGDADYKFMICVDSAAIETPLMLKPYEEWKGYQELSNVSSSYCSGQLDPSKVLYGFH